MTTEVLNNKSLQDVKKATGEVAWKSPSNIALVKYWGKYGVQLPCNPSISFTLNNSCTTTTLKFTPKKGEEFDVRFELSGERKESFEVKIKKFLESISNEVSFIPEFDFVIESSNSFPHSTGIASSASGMSAIALCLCSIEKDLGLENLSEEAFFQKASHLARLGSGSACRSVYGGMVSWGETKDLDGASNLYGTPFTDNLHPVFKTYQDTVLIVDEMEKKVSSRIGHGLMETNPFSQQRFVQANENLAKLKAVLQSGDQEEFIKIVESEALTLHGMMMTSDPYYLLMRPNTLEIIERIFAFREKTGLPVSFTLDAGPNIHLLYPENIKEEIKNFINSELLSYLSRGKFIDDSVGNGPERIK
jgi:diphosphomevalonate decarboxylase